MNKGIVFKVSTFKINVGLPIDDRTVLSSAERERLITLRRYKWMIVTNEENGKLYQLQPPKINNTFINDAPLEEWIFNIIQTDVGAILTQDLTTFTQELNLPAGTYPAGMTIEDLLRILLIRTRAAVPPTINITPTQVLREKGSTGNITFNHVYTINDLPPSQWENEIKWYADNIVQGDNTIPFFNLLSAISVHATRNYNKVDPSPGIEPGFPAGTAISPTRYITPVLPYYFGRSTSDYFFKPENISQARIQSFLNNNNTGNSRACTKVLGLAPSIISIPYPDWQDTDGIWDWKYVLIPKSWNKIISSYFHNGLDAGIVGTGAWSVITEFTLNSPTDIWFNEPYILYSTAYRVGGDYSLQDLYKFYLLNV